MSDPQRYLSDLNAVKDAAWEKMNRPTNVKKQYPTIEQAIHGLQGEVNELIEAVMNGESLDAITKECGDVVGWTAILRNVCLWKDIRPCPGPTSK